MERTYILRLRPIFDSDYYCNTTHTSFARITIAMRRHHHQMQCLLLALEAETRHRIYNYVFFIPTATGKVTLVIQRKRTKRAKPPSTALPFSVLALLQTCQQIRDEAEPIFYNINHLQLRDRDDRSGFSTLFQHPYSIGKARREAIRALTVRCWQSGSDRLNIGRPHRCPSLEVLHLALDSKTGEDIIMLLHSHHGLLKQLWSYLAKLANLKEIRIIAPPGCNELERCEEIEAALQYSHERKKERRARRMQQRSE